MSAEARELRAELDNAMSERENWRNTARELLRENAALRDALRECLPLLNHVAGVGLEACGAAKRVPAVEAKAVAALRGAAD